MCVCVICKCDPILYKSFAYLKKVLKPIPTDTKWPLNLSVVMFFCLIMNKTSKHSLNHESTLHGMSKAQKDEYSLIVLI